MNYGSREFWSANIFKKIKAFLLLLSASDRKAALGLLILLTVAALIDTLGVASVLPLITIMTKPDVVMNNSTISSLYLRLGSPGLENFQIYLGIFFVLFLLMALAVKAFAITCQIKFTYSVQHSLSVRLIERYLYQPYSWFLNRNSSGLGKSILSEVDQVISETLVPLLTLFAQGFLVFCLLALTIVANPILAAATFGFFLFVYTLIYKAVRSRLFNDGVDRAAANNERFRLVSEAFGGIKEVKFGGLESNVLSNFDRVSFRYTKSKSFSQATAQLPRYVLELLIFSGIIILVFSLKAKEGFLGTIPTVTLYAFVGYRLMPAMQLVYSSINTLRFSQHMFERIHSELVPPRSCLSVGREVGAVSFDALLQLKNVSYSYPNTQAPALRNLTFDIRAKSCIAVVGISGSGKSTLVDVILGLLELDEGEILVDGVPIAHDNIRSWQGQIGYVPQSIFLLDDKISSNIAFAISEEEIDPHELRRAAIAAGLHDFIISELPFGYDTIVGERGIRLSGGQRQRIGIARALYRRPKLLILDEGTSALDGFTERAVMDAVYTLSKDTTVILVSHRLSTVMECDEIFVIDSGRIVDRGNYFELLSNSANFSRLVGVPS